MTCILEALYYIVMYLLSLIFVILLQKKKSNLVVAVKNIVSHQIVYVVYKLIFVEVSFTDYLTLIFHGEFIIFLHWRCY